MKYRMVIQANQNEMFHVFMENFRDEYFMEKGKILPIEKVKKGFTFQKNISRDKRKKQQRRATVKVLDFQCPSLYKVEYISDRYRKVTGVMMNQLDDNRLEIILEEIMDKSVIDEHGKSEWIPQISASDEIKKASWWKKFQYKYLARSIKLKKKKEEKNK